MELRSVDGKTVYAEVHEFDLHFDKDTFKCAGGQAVNVSGWGWSSLGEDEVVSQQDEGYS